MALSVDENLNTSQLQGFLTEAHCPQLVTVRTEPLTTVYDVESRPFARGKFATVRRCRHKTTGVDYAAKYIRKRRRAADVRHEIMHEAYVLKMSANNPHIVQLHEVFESHSEIILVLEMVPGGELQRALDDEEVIDEREAARLMRQVIEGLSFLHDRKIAHLDLKPQNILLTRAYPQCDVKLCDFGISRLITKGIEIREIIGTPDYVAPEILHYEPINLATDMWSIGILTYVILSGHSPFGGDNKQETFCNITHGILEFPPELFSNVSNDAKDFICRLLVRNARDRMTVKECLAHPWLRQHDRSNSISSLGVELSLSCPSPLEKTKEKHEVSTEPSAPKQEISVIPVQVVQEETFSHQVPPLLESRQPKITVAESPCRLVPSVEKHCNKLLPSEGDHKLVRRLEERETVISEIEGFKLTKRLIFSEEIIVDDRVGLVY